MNLNSLSIHEKVCQTMIVKADPKKHTRLYGSIKGFLEKYPVGGIFIGTEMFLSGDFDLDGIRKTIEEYQRHSKVPLLVAADAERGISFLPGNFTDYPPCMALGSAKDSELAYNYGAAIAKEARAVGINWTFAPVCDLNINRYNEIVSVRSISNDPNLASEMLKSEIRGFAENGVLTTGKHFPGDGCDVRNQHIVGSVNNLSKEEWMNTYGRVYKAVFDAGLASVMVGHISIPAFQNDAVSGIYPPATLSKDAIGLLKNTLGFKGATITDAMDMGGFVRFRFSRKDAELEAFKSGIDMMLWPRDETADLIENAIESGDIPLSRLNDAIDRIAFMKGKLEEFGFGAEENTDPEFSKETADSLADRASTLVSNSLGLLPVSKDKIKKVRIITASECFLCSPEEAESATLKKAKKIASMFEKRGAKVDIKTKWDVYLSDYEAGEIDCDYDLILYLAFANSALPMYSRELVNLHSAQRFDNDKTIVMVIGTPHYLKEYFPVAESAIHTYDNERCLEAAVASIYGEKPWLGSLPIA